MEDEDDRDDTDRRIFGAKCTEHGLWDRDAWHVDGLEDWDDGPPPRLSCYRVEHEPDATGVLIEIEFDDAGDVSSYVVMAALHIDDALEFQVRDDAIMKYDELVGSVQGWTSSISSQAQADPRSAP